MVTIYENNNQQVAGVPTNDDVNGNDSLKEESSLEMGNPGNLSPNLEKFLNEIEKRVSELKTGDGPATQVSEVLGGLARMYERIRTTVEYKGEHVLRRNAIERMLRRLVWEQETVRSNIDTSKVAETLIKELIWARYLPNGVVPKNKSREVEEVIEKYIYFLRNLDNVPTGVSASKMRTWMWGLASSEIEDVVDPSYRELYVQLMYDWFVDYYKWTDTTLSEHDKEIQIYLAIHRAFPKSDDPIMRYHLLLKEFPNWRNADKSEVNKLILQFPSVYDEIENHLSYPGRFSLYRRVQKHAAAFDIFHVISILEKENLRGLVEDRKVFEEKVRDICESKYKQIKRRVSTGIVRSIIYIFLTKVLIAMLIEIPYEVFVYDDVRFLPLTINIILPSMIMWFIGLSIRVPGAKNTETIISRLGSLVYKVEKKSIQPFSISKSGKNSSLAGLFAIFYAFMFILVFGTITYFLTLLNFTVFAILIFFAFLSLVMLFAYRVRFNANQLKVEVNGESFSSHLASYLTLPFLNFGFYLSKGLAKINFFTIFLDFLIEAPLKSIIEIFEEWTSYLREKKEEVVEIPE